MAAKKSVQLSGVVVAESAICSIDPDEGVLMYRGYDIADLAEHSTYEETALLLLDGELPSSDALAAFESELGDRELPLATAKLIDRSAGQAAPMEMLRPAGGGRGRDRRARRAPARGRQRGRRGHVRALGLGGAHACRGARHARAQGEALRLRASALRRIRPARGHPQADLGGLLARRRRAELVRDHRGGRADGVRGEGPLPERRSLVGVGLPLPGRTD